MPSLPQPEPATPGNSAIHRKIRTHILPFIFLLYVVAFLDRINIGFAALTMNRDLGITSEQFGLLAGIFFCGYFLFEIPSNLLLCKIGARVWIARILLSWGVVATLTGFAQSASQLYILRFVLGIAEAGFFPGMILYLTYWFRQREQARAIALFMAASPLTSVIGAPISGVILDYVHWFQLPSWRWLLMIEGLPALVCGVATLFVLPDGPAQAKFLTPDERAAIASELEMEKLRSPEKQEVHATRALRHGRVWHLALIYFSMIVGFYCLNFWAPQIVKLHFSHSSNTVIGLLVMVPQMVGLLSMILISRSSDRRLERRWHAAIPSVIGGIAFVFLGVSSSPVISIVLLSLAAVGVYSFFGPFWSMPATFLTGFAAASGIALINSVGNLGGFAGPYLVGVLGGEGGNLFAGLAAAGVAMAIAAGLMLLLPAEKAAV